MGGARRCGGINGIARVTAGGESDQRREKGKEQERETMAEESGHFLTGEFAAKSAGIPVPGCTCLPAACNQPLSSPIAALIGPMQESRMEQADK